MSLSYSFPYAASTIYAAVDPRGRLTVEHRSQAARRSPQQHTVVLRGVGWYCIYPQVPPSQGLALVSISQCRKCRIVWDAF